MILFFQNPIHQLYVHFCYDFFGIVFIIEFLPGELINQLHRIRRQNIQPIDSMLTTHRLHQIGSHKAVDPRYKYVHLCKIKVNFYSIKIQFTKCSQNARKRISSFPGCVQNLVLNIVYFIRWIMLFL